MTCAESKIIGKGGNANEKTDHDCIDCCGCRAGGAEPDDQVRPRTGCCVSDRESVYFMEHNEKIEIPPAATDGR